MTGFNPKSSGIGSDCTVTFATTAAPRTILIQLFFNFIFLFIAPSCEKSFLSTSILLLLSMLLALANTYV